MSINSFISDYQIEPADAIVLNKKFFGMLDHYVIYLGIQDWEHKFVANYVDGVKIIPTEQIDSHLQVYVPSRVEKFKGSNLKRNEAINRALNKIGERAYDIVSNNCEHFKNYVHNGVASSTQVQQAGAALTVGGIGLALFGIGKKDKSSIVWGFVILIIGILIASLSKKEDDHKRIISR